MFNLVDVNSFKPRCSYLESIMGRIGLTEKQESKLEELQNRANGIGRPLTDKMEAERLDLVHKKYNPELPEGCKTYLKKWYAEQLYGKSEQLDSKYTKKGNYCEGEAILVIEEMFGGFGEKFSKNETRYKNEWIEGEPDVLSNGVVYDAKCPWDGTTFLDAVTGKDKSIYVWQMRGYCWLTESDKAIVCYVLLDTPADVNYGQEVSFSDVHIEDRFYSFTVERDTEIEEEIKERVELCRKWLAEYDQLVYKKITGN